MWLRESTPKYGSVLICSLGGLIPLLVESGGCGGGCHLGFWYIIYHLETFGSIHVNSRIGRGGECGAGLQHSWYVVRLRWLCV